MALVQWSPLLGCTAVEAFLALRELQVIIQTLDEKKPAPKDGKQVEDGKAKEN